MAAGQTSIIGKLLNTLGGKVGGKDSGSGPNDRIKRLGLSERQQALNRLWGWYRGQQYEARALDWNGRPYMDPIATEAIASRGFIPPGFEGQAMSSTPIKFRRPTSPYQLAKVIVDRFTGLLFSEQQHPVVSVTGDPVTEDFIRCIADVSRVWQQMILARNYGGAMGSVAVGFQFVDGKPVVEVHDPRWCQPDFVERSNFELKAIEKRYQYPVEQRDPKTGRYETVPFWYRRVINQQSDVVYKPVEVGNGDEPDWVVEKQVDHGLGFCPVVWVQNLPVQDEVDGDPDCLGTYESMEAIDQLIAQAHKAIINNCDPTLVITTDSEMAPEIAKGSGNALKIPKGDAKYLEMMASGPKAALELITELRKMILEIAQCVLEQPNVANKTATEVERNFSSMLAKADVLREQYGERGVKPLLEMMWKAAETMSQPVPAPGPDGQPSMVRQELALPSKYITDATTGAQIEVKREMGTGGVINLNWPGYFRPPLTDVLTAVQAAGTAKQSGLVDAMTVAKFLAPFFDVDDVVKMQKAADDETQAKQNQLMQDSLATPDKQFP